MPTVRRVAYILLALALYTIPVVALDGFAASGYLSQAVYTIDRRLAEQNASNCPIDHYLEPPNLCVKCGRGQFAPAGSASCMECPEHEKSDGKGGCTCLPNYFFNSERVCSPCPEGAICVRGHIISTMPGYYQAYDAQLGDPPLKCPFGRVSCLANNTCAEGYTGPACSICEEFWARAGDTCEECDGMSGLGIPAICVLGALTSLTAAWQITARSPKLKELMLRLEGNLSTRILIMVLTAQVICGWLGNYYLLFRSILEDPRAKTFHDTVSVLRKACGVLAFMVPETFGVRCAALSSLDFFALQLVAPFAYIVAYMLIAFLKEIVRREKAICKLLRVELVWFSFWCTYLTYASLTTTIVQHAPIEGLAFDCSLGRPCRLRDDYEIAIDEPPYTTNGLPLVLAGTVLYIIFVPSIYMAFLFRYRFILQGGERQFTDDALVVVQRRDSLAAEAGIDIVSQLYRSYKPTYFYFEVVNLCRQATLVGGVALAGKSSPAMYISLSLVTTSVYLVTLLKYRPYAKEMDNKIQIGCTVGLIIGYGFQACATLLGEEDTRNGGKVQDEALYLGVLATCTFFMLFIGLVVSSVLESAQEMKLWQAVLKAGEAKLNFMNGQEKRGRTPFVGRILENQCRECIASFPGAYAKQWDQLVENQSLSTACVFLTSPETGLGQHAQNPNHPSECWCPFIYGKISPGCYISVLKKPENDEEEATYAEREGFAEVDAAAMGQVLIKERDYLNDSAFYEAQRIAHKYADQRSKNNNYRAPWGCQWFQEWRNNVKTAVKSKQKLIVYYFEGKVGRGEVAWEDLADTEKIKEAKIGTGLGASQTVEVAFMEHKNIKFERRSIAEFGAEEPVARAKKPAPQKTKPQPAARTLPGPETAASDSTTMPELRHSKTMPELSKIKNERICEQVPFDQDFSGCPSEGGNGRLRKVNQPKKQRTKDFEPAQTYDSVQSEPVAKKKLKKKKTKELPDTMDHASSSPDPTTSASAEAMPDQAGRKPNVWF